MIDVLFAIIAVCVALSFAGLMFMCLSPLIEALNEWLGE